MKNTLIISIIISIAICCSCSQDDRILSTCGSSSYCYTLRPEYFRMYGDEKIIMETCSDLLSIRFSASLSSSEIDRIMQKYNLSIVKPGDNSYKLYIVQTDDAFAAVPLLLREKHLSPDATNIEYVGPVFVWSMCNNEPLYTIPTNLIAVKGNVEDKEVKTLLQVADARLVEVIELSSFKNFIYQMPWGDPGELFDLANNLHFHPAIEYAEPNMLVYICWYDNLNRFFNSNMERISAKPLEPSARDSHDGYSESAAPRPARSSATYR